MTLVEHIALLTEQIAREIETLEVSQGNLSTLQTLTKVSLVAAINELKGLIGTNGAGASIDDTLTTSTGKTYSIDKILSIANQVKQDILGGVPSAAFDTLKEIADYIANDQTAAGNIVNALGLRVRVDQAQTFTAEQKSTARVNIGALGIDLIGDPDTDFLLIYNTARG